MLLDLQDLFNGVVDDEDDEDSLACHHEVVHGGDVTDQFHRTEVERRDATTSGRVLKQESGQRWNSFSISLEVQCKPMGTSVFKLQLSWKKLLSISTDPVYF